MRIVHLVGMLGLSLAACSHAEAKSMRASWYGSESGSRMANGEHFNPRAFVAAHRTLPFGTVLRVTNPACGKTVNVTVKDRGPFVRGRSLDVSSGAAAALCMKRSGTAALEVDVISLGSGQRGAPEKESFFAFSAFGWGSSREAGDSYAMHDRFRLHGPVSQ